MKLPFNVSEREKKYLVFAGVAVVLMLLYQLFSWYSNVKENVSDISDMKWTMLKKQLNHLSKKDDVEKRAKILLQELEIQEKTFLRGNKPPVAAATLQKFLKDSASSLAINVKLERTLNPVETEYYLGIPVEIGFTASTTKLKDLLVRIKKSKSMLIITEVKVKVTNVRDPVDIYTTLIVTGFIKKPEIKMQDEKKVKNAA